MRQIVIPGEVPETPNGLDVKLSTDLSALSVDTVVDGQRVAQVVMTKRETASLIDALVRLYSQMREVV